MFDRLRRVTKVNGADEVLGTEAVPRRRYRAGGEDHVWAAALAGARSTAADVGHGELEGALERHQVLDGSSTRSRSRWPCRCGSASKPRTSWPAATDEAAGLLRDAYREWKGASTSWWATWCAPRTAAAAYAVLAPGTPVCWVVDPSGPGGRDEDGNVLAGPCRPASRSRRVIGIPRHRGCRCLLGLTHG